MAFGPSAPNMLLGTRSALSMSELIVWSRLWAPSSFMIRLSLSRVDSLTAIVVVMIDMEYML